MPELSAIIAAAGEGSRFGRRTPKQLLEVAGRPMVEWSVERLLTVACEVVIAVPAALLGAFETRFADRPEVRCVAGGATRLQSVRRAFECTSGEASDLVAIHDAARPALAAEDLARVVETAAVCGAAVLGRPVSDTIKRVSGGRIESTVDRSQLFQAETPQVFTRRLLSRALSLADEASAGETIEATDESSLVEAFGDVEVAAVIAERPNPKLTFAGDLVLIEALLADGNRRLRSRA